jgi:hypothetical protein
MRLLQLSTILKDRRTEQAQGLSKLSQWSGGIQVVVQSSQSSPRQEWIGAVSMGLRFVNATCQGLEESRTGGFVAWYGVDLPSSLPTGYSGTGFSTDAYCGRTLHSTQSRFEQLNSRTGFCGSCRHPNCNQHGGHQVCSSYTTHPLLSGRLTASCAMSRRTTPMHACSGPFALPFLIFPRKDFWRPFLCARPDTLPYRNADWLEPCD